MRTPAIARIVVGALAAVFARSASAQSQQRATDSSIAAPRAPHYYRSLALGAATSLAAHELGHLAVSLSTGSRPTFGFDKPRPTIYSGISLHERGVLAGGIGTTLFYLTIGRTGSVSDVVTHDSSYAHFFVAPTTRGLAGGFSHSTP